MYAKWSGMPMLFGLTFKKYVNNENNAWYVLIWVRDEPRTMVVSQNI